MIKWSKYVALIPPQIKIGKSTYEILWVEEFPKDKEQLGETRFDDNKQIIIKIGQSDKESVHTYWHEVLHAASEEYNVGLTENQVLSMEKFLKDLLRNGNLWKKESRNETYKRKRRNFKRIRQVSKKAR